MHWTRFLAFNVLGAALWVAVWTSVGYFSGRHIDVIYREATRYDTYLAIAVGGAADRVRVSRALSTATATSRERPRKLSRPFERSCS